MGEGGRRVIYNIILNERPLYFSPMNKSEQLNYTPNNKQKVYYGCFPM